VTPVARKPRVVLFDYGSGNIRSGERALERAGASVEVTSDVSAALAADGVVVPGVGAFAACMASLQRVGGDRVVTERRAAAGPVLGICVGHQVFFAGGEEHGTSTKGLGVWPGEVTEVRAPVLPHIGWNTVSVPTGSQMFAGISEQRFYFVHSYAAHEVPSGSQETMAAWTTYGDDTFIAAVEDGPLWATQFHPEKSGEAGIHLLRNWIATL
jgi:imidazole glycerol-phosphate synthase subunit HisH